jgi:predicted nucleic-acid-binding protein
MIGIDTNVLVRHMVQDDAGQAVLATELIESHCSVAAPGHVNLVVLCELVWVLSTAYGFARAQIAGALRQILVTESLDIQEHALAWCAARDYAEGHCDYADCVIARLNAARGTSTTFTFDRQAGRSPGFTLLSAATLPPT